MPRFRTTFHGLAVKWSPFVDSRLAVATSQNFGIIGNGRLHILEVRARHRATVQAGTQLAATANAAANATHDATHHTACTCTRS
jgi:hypothetical protein